MDRDKVINGLELLAHWPDGLIITDKEKWIKPCCEMAVSLLKEQEPKTGKWERQYSRPGVYANLFWWCSVCKEPTRYNDAGIFYKYCPRCGAKLEPCRET